MATITGSKYSGSVSSISGNTFTAVSGTFVTGDFDTPRIISLFDSSDEFKGIAYVKSFTSASVLETELGFFDPVDLSPVAFAAGDTYLVSLNFSEVVTTGLAVSGDRVTMTADHTFGAATNQKQLCLYDESKQITSTNQLEFSGGVVVLGHIVDLVNDLIQGGCSLNLLHAGPPYLSLLKGVNLNSHRYIFGGQFLSLSTPTYVGDGSGGDSHSIVLDGVYSECDLLTQGGGANWTRNPLRHVLRNISTFANGFNAIAIRWGDGIVQGGTVKLSGSTAISLFGSDDGGTYALSAPAGQRLVVLEAGNGTKPNLWRSSTTPTQTVNFTNVVSLKKGMVTGTAGDPNPNASANWYYKGLFTAMENGTKLFIRDSALGVADSGTAGVSGELELTVLESTVIGVTETVVEANWTFGACAYNKQINAGSFATTTKETIGGTAKDVPLGGIVAQIIDVNVTEVTKATVDAYTELTTSQQLYDRAKSYLYDNYVGESAMTVGRSGDKIDLGSRTLVIDAAAVSVYANAANITIKASSYSGGATATTGGVTTQNGALLNGGTFDCDVIYDSGASTTLTNVTVNGVVDFTTAGTYTLEGCAISEVTNSSGGAVTINLVNSSVTTNTGPDITLNNEVAITIAVKNATDGANIEGAIVYIEAAAGGPLTAGDVIMSQLTNASGISEDAAFNFTSNQPVVGRVRKGTSAPYYKSSSLSGTITTGGLVQTVFLIEDH